MSSEEQDRGTAPEAEAASDPLDTNDSLMKEFWTFLMENKLWWITPTVLILLLVIGFIIITAVSGGGPVAPFIYTLF